MKSKMKRRMLAIVLCMVIVLSNSSFIFASSGTEEPAAVAQEGDPQNVQETQTEAAVQDTPAVLSETTPEATPEATPEPTQVPEVTAAPTEAPQATVEPTQMPEVTAAPEATPAPTETPAVTAEPTQAPEVTVAPETTPEATPVPSEAPVNEVQQTELQPYHAVYEDNAITITVSAEAGIIPEGAELKVTPIEKKEITSGMTEEEKAEAEAVNHQYDLTEKKLTEDSEANDTMMQGFLAYDISFLVNGQETEPNGDVKVVMDFKEAAVPEGVSEDADVAVKHLREEAIAEDGVIVEDITEKAQLEATEKAEIEKVELISDSFSIFTINWEKQFIKVYVVDEKGQPIKEDERYELSGKYKNDTGVSVDSIAERIKEELDIESEFLKAIICEKDTFEYDAQEIKGLKTNSTDPKYTKDMSVDKPSWTTFSLTEKTVYFIFGDDPKTELPDVIQTADTEKFIDLSLFDYVVGSAPDYSEYNQSTNQWAGDTTGINRGHALKFQTNAGGRNENSINASKSPNPNTEIVKPLLQKDPGNGNDLNLYPVLNNDKSEQSSESLAYLFNSASIDDVKSVHEDLNYLFTYTDSTREYSFNSDLNYAYLDTENGSKDFIVYSEPATIHSGTWGTDNYKESHGFFPFSKYEAVDGTERKWQTGVDLDCNEKQNHYFGMSMRTNFMQPKGGQIAENTDMIFSFSGDDDVWVFIDDVLVMDIGGSHTAVSGTINFRTGKVTVGNSTAYIGDLLLESNPELEDKVYRNNLEGDQKISTLKDYETYSLDFFYLERGNYDSNCSLKFNLAMIEKNSVSVGKEITDVDTSKYGDIEFEYLIKVGDSKETLAPYTNKKYKIYNLDDRTYTGKTGTTDGAGKFKLKHNELAVFEEDTATGTDGIDENLYYQVTELNLNSHEYNEVKINSTEIVSEDREENVSQDGVITGNATNQQYDAPSPVYQVADTNSVIFRNRCSAYNQRELHIKKEMSGNSSDETFTVSVKLNEKLYNGQYFLIDQNGTKTSLSTSDGSVNLKPGQEVIIDTIPSGTKFEVKESELDTNIYALPVYEVVNGGTAPQTEECAAGTTVVDVDTFVTITNALKSAQDNPYIEIQKTFSGLDKTEVDKLYSNFKIVIYTDSNLTKKVAELTLSSATRSDDGLVFTWKRQDLEEGTYYIKEEGTNLEGYVLNSVTVNGEEVNEWPQMVKTQAPTYEKVGEIRVPQGNEREFEFLSNYNFIAATLQKSKTYFVWTEKPLSSGEQEAIKIFIAGCSSDFNQITSNDATIYFYSSLQNLEQGIVVNEGTVKVSEESAGKRTLSFASSSKQWSQVLFGEYKVKDPVDAEISITNHYEEHGVDVDLEKYGTGWKQQIAGAEFELVSGVKSNGKIVWNEGSVKTVIVDDTQESKIDLPKLKSGYYRLKETKAPIGYSLLNDTIYFVVDAGEQTVALTDANGNILQNQTEEFYKIESGKPAIIQIMNKALYDLPSAGGSGIFWYLISGTAFLMAASLILYRMKRKEVLGK